MSSAKRTANYNFCTYSCINPFLYQYQIQRKVGLLPLHMVCKINIVDQRRILFYNKFVQPRWPYDMRPSARAEKYIRDAGP